MQDRIKELAIEAGLSIGYDGNVYAGGDVVIDGVPFDAVERLIKAVARECERIASTSACISKQCGHADLARGSENAAEAIRARFGIKE